jgi:glyoxylase-like metal-dependent hydrolase (beta-lactamase superfamily II)
MVLSCVVATAGVACAPQRTLAHDAAVSLAHSDRWSYADSRVGTYVSSNWGFSTNTFWIEGPDGVVVVDTQFLPSAAAEMLSWVEQATGKPVVLAVVLHPNPDKFNGAATLQKRGVRVVTSDEVRALVPSVHEKRLRAFGARYAPDYPRDAPKLDSFGAVTTDLHAAGLVLRAHVLGAGCSEAHVALEWEGHLFTGDLVASGGHSWMELGLLDEWHKRIAELRALKPAFVHPGRGPSGGPGLLDEEESYLRHVESIVQGEHPSMPVRADAIARVKRALLDSYPSYEYDVFLDIGLPAVWERLARGGGT